MGVKYLYQDDLGSTELLVTLSPEILSVLLHELWGDSSNALKRLDSERIAQVTLRIRLYDPKFLRTLHHDVQVFDYTPLLKALKPN